MWGFAYERAAGRLRCKKWGSGTGQKPCLLGFSLFDALIYLKMGLEYMFSLFWARDVILLLLGVLLPVGYSLDAVQILCPGNRALPFLAGNTTPSDSIIAIAK